MPSTAPIATKLRIKPDDRFGLFSAPPGYAAKVRPPALGHREVQLRAGSSAATARRLDGALVFARTTRDLRAAARVAKSVKRDGLIWVA